MCSCREQGDSTARAENGGRAVGDGYKGDFKRQIQRAQTIPLRHFAWDAYNANVKGPFEGFDRGHDMV